MSPSLAALGRQASGAGFIVFVLTLFLSIGVGAALHLNRTHDTVLETQQALAALQARAAEDYLTQTLGVIDLTLRGLIEGDRPDPGPELRRALRNTPYLRSLSVADAEGRILFSTTAANLGVWINLADLLPPLEAGTHQLRLSAPRAGRDLHDSHPIATSGADPASRTFFSAIKPLAWQGQEAYLVAAVNSDFFINHYAHNVEAQRGQVEVFRYDAILMFSTDERRRPGLLDPGALPFQAGIPPEREIGESPAARLDSQPTLAAYRASRHYPMVAVMHIPIAQALTTWRQDRDSVLQFVVPTLTILFLLGGAALYQWRRSALEYRRAEHAKRESRELRQRIQEKDLLHDQLQQLALLDPLTGLHNRRYLDETAGQALDQARSRGTPLTLLILDIDHFKQVNDTHGHAAGDQMLIALAGLLRAQTRPTDIVCRTGGEEFLLLLPHLPLTPAIERAEQLRLACAALAVRCGGRTLTATLSIGLANYPAHADDLETLMQLADAALYAAKRGGRDRVVVASVGAPEASGSPLSPPPAAPAPP